MASAAVERPHLLARLALRLTDFSERYIPDAFVFALLATIIVFFAGILVAGAGPTQMVESWGKGLWDLLPFTMQMALIIIGGYVISTAPPTLRFIDWLTRRVSTGRGAITLCAFCSMASSWFNWGLSLIFSAVLARRLAARHPSTDYRALAATTFLGLGSVWAQGLSGSAALQMATPGALQPAIRAIVARGGHAPGGMIPLTHTIFLWQSMVSVVVEIAVVTFVVWLFSPPPSRAVSAQMLGVEVPEEAGTVSRDEARTPGEWLEHSGILNYAIAALGIAYLVGYFGRAESKLAALTVNTINLAFLVIGMLLHRTPARLMTAVRGAVPTTWGIVLQYPFYAGIAGMITYTHLNDRIAEMFARVSSAATFPALIALYSAALGVFVPSGGSKWVIEAPYVMAAAHDVKAHLGWTVAAYDLGEALANLVQPFFMLPTLAMLGLRARDVMGYTFIVFLVLLPVVLGLVIGLGGTLHYPL